MSSRRTFLKQIRLQKRCLWDGNDLNHHCARGNGKVHDFCDLSCVRNYYVFKKKLENLSNRDPEKKKKYIEDFVQYCLWRMIDRNAAIILDKELKVVRSEKTVFVEMIQTGVIIVQSSLDAGIEKCLV